MTFENILPKLKDGQKVVRSGWGGAEEYVFLKDIGELDGTTMTPFFVIQVEGEGLSMFQPTDCDILAEDWKVVE